MELLVPPTTVTLFLPILVTDVKKQLIINTDEDDSYLEGLILAATAKLEKDSRNLLIQRSLIQNTDRIEGTSLDYSNVISIDKIQYYNTDGTIVDYDSSSYYLDEYSNRLELTSKYSLIAISNTSKRPFIITYTAGFINRNANATLERAKVPADLMHALKLLVAHYYENREASSQSKLNELPLGYCDIVNSYNANI